MDLGSFAREARFAGRAAGLYEQRRGFCETLAFSAASNRRKCACEAPHIIHGNVRGFTRSFACFCLGTCFEGCALSGDFGGVEPPKLLHFCKTSFSKNAWGTPRRGFPQTLFRWGKNSCFSPRPPLALANAFWSLRSSSAASPRVPSATKKLFLKKKFFGFSKRLLYAARCLIRARQRLISPTC